MIISYLVIINIRNISTVPASQKLDPVFLLFGHNIWVGRKRGCCRYHPVLQCRWGWKRTICFDLQCWSRWQKWATKF